MADDDDDDAIIVPLFKASQEPTWRARVIGSTPLYYCGGSDPHSDRPPHVRAASSLSWLGRRLTAIQDDANFVALIDLQERAIEAIPLPCGLSGERLFDDLRGNKHLKLDLEACVVVPAGPCELLVAFGSGSNAHRESVVTVEWADERPGSVRRFAVPDFYATLRSLVAFAGSELNVEGAVYLADDRLRLFQRGNGAARAGLKPIDATCDLVWSHLLSHIVDPARTSPPRPTNIVRYDLGMLDGVRLTFTDATESRGNVLFTATAEASPDVLRDGFVVGSVLGRISGNAVRWSPLEDFDGRRFPGKVEGICLDPVRSHRAWLLVDRDDPRVASELCEVELTGDWFELR